MSFLQPTGAAASVSAVLRADVLTGLSCVVAGVGCTAEVAEMVAFLACPAAALIIGQPLQIDGGLSLAGTTLLAPETQTGGAATSTMPS